MTPKNHSQKGGIVVSDLAFAYPGAEPLFFGISFRVRAGETIGLVGENGIGKTTLLRILAGDLHAIDGAFQIAEDVLYLPQWVGVDRQGQSVRSFLTSIAPGHVRRLAEDLSRAEAAERQDSTPETSIALAAAINEWSAAGGYSEEARWDRITRKVLGQGLQAAESRPMRELSGGEAKRIALESMLQSDTSVLLLDEPDNFLDVQGKIWLDDQLRSSKKCILLVSHDRTLLSTSATKLVTMEATGAWVHGGSYATYPEARQKRIEQLGENLDRWKEEERRLFRFYKWMKTRAAMSDKNAPYADAAESRWKRFVEAGPPPAPPRRQAITMRLQSDRSGRRVLECRGLGLSDLVFPYDLDVTVGEKVALLGSNGAGKSHVLRLFAGEMIEHEGTFRLGASVTVGYFSQHGLEAAMAGRQVLDLVRGPVPNEESARRLLARYGLQDRVREDAANLSGGQRARLQIALLEAGGANFLLLDEPTDNLDLGSAEALELALAEFSGTVMCVTHDRAFMGNLDRFLVLDDDGDVREPADLETALALISGIETAAGANVRSLSVL